MAAPKAPRIRFSPWLKTTDLASNKPPNQPGVYLLAHFARPPRGPANHQQRQILYVGETRGQSLRARLSQFQASASNRRSAHSGGNTYFATHGTKLAEHLHVSWLAVPPFGPPESPHRSRFISYVEQKVLWELTRRHGGVGLLSKFKADKLR